MSLDTPHSAKTKSMFGHHSRQREIADVFVRHAWGYLLVVAGLDHLVPTRAGPQRGHDSLTPAEHLRVALEELGPTFIKLGQLLSTRPDVLAPEYRLELAKLQDAAPQLPGEVVRDAIAAELGADLENAFANFDPDPLAAASIGQAHAATRYDGTEVVVKIRRPGAVQQVEQDLEILKGFAAYADRHWESAALYDPVGLADEFAATLHAELDYLQEARNAERFASSFAGDPDVHIPKVFWETTTSRVITLERIHGLKITDLAALDAAGIDRHELAQRATRLVAKMVFEDGFFHADPHPGNFFIERGGRVGMIDFGMVGTIDDRLREQLGKFLIALVREDPDRLASALLDLTVTREPVDHTRLRDDLAGLLGRYSDQALGDIRLGEIIGEILEIVRRHRLRSRHDLALLVKAFIMDEGIAAELDPDFRLLEALAPYAYRHLAAQLSPSALVNSLEHAGVGLAELAVDLPGEVHRILHAMAMGDLQLHLRADEFAPLVARSERVGNRIAAAVLAAAAINGLVTLTTSPHGASVNRRSLTLTTVLTAVGLYAARRITR
jgi:ubiquinone biosynthesis protein